MITDAGISAISDAAGKLFTEIGATVRQLGGKRQKALELASEMQQQRMERLSAQSIEQPNSNAVYWVLGAILLVLIVLAVIIRNK